MSADSLGYFVNIDGKAIPIKRKKKAEAISERLNKTISFPVSRCKIYEFDMILISEKRILFIKNLYF